MNPHRHIFAITLVVLATLPGLYFRLAGIHLNPVSMSVVSGIAILAAAFLVLWACDVAQQDISQTLALAMVAFVAVLPEYAVDMYFTWMAGQHPEGEYAHYAIANMTGANRLLIGVGWPVIVIICWFKTRGAVFLEKDRVTELFFLGLATVYAFIVALKGTLAWYDCIVFMGLFAWYIVLASKKPCVECDLAGPAKLVGSLPKVNRRFVTLLMFLYSAFVIVANAEPFSEGLVATGKAFGIDEFLLVQWLAPLASEAPEFVVAIMFALRGQSGLALGSLLSAKVNQWTLLVGMIPGVYAVSSGQLAVPIPMSNLQMHEILLTAAQSLLGLALLAAFRLSFGEAFLLLGLFLGQFFLSPIADNMAAKGLIQISGDQVHQIFSTVYVAVAFTLFFIKPARFKGILQGAKVDPDVRMIPLLSEKGEGPSKTAD